MINRNKHSLLFFRCNINRKVHLITAIVMIALSGLACNYISSPSASDETGAQEREEKQADEPEQVETSAVEDAEILEFTDLDAPTITTDSGLQYRDEIIGQGRVAQAGDVVVVHYVGWLLDGTKFDSSIDRNTPFEFNLGAGRVISGWDEGVAGMRVGGIRILTIPPDLGYGDRGAGSSIPPGATLIFQVELLEISTPE